MFYFLFFLLIGLFYFFSPIFFSGWDIIASGNLDGSLTNYIYEHFYLYFAGNSEIHSSFWTLPIFYPVKNTLAFSDTLISTAPLYLLFRVFADYSISYSLTVICFSIFNFTVFYQILRRFKFSALLSSFGAFLYAFSFNNKITQMHVQLVTQFFYMGALLCLLHVSKYNSKLKNRMLFVGAAILFAGQFYSAYYLGFFAFLMSLIFMLFMCFSKYTFKKQAFFFIRYRKEIILFLTLFILLVSPLAFMYLNTGIVRDYSLINYNIPNILGIFRGNTFVISQFLPILQESVNVELMLMINVFLLIFGIWGLLKINNYGKILAALVLFVIIIIIKFPSLENFSLWKIIYTFIWGSKGIREPIRMILLINPILIYGFINFLRTLKHKKTIAVILALIALFSEYTKISFHSRSYNFDQKIQKELLQTNNIENCKYLDVKFDVESPTDIYTYVEKDVFRLRLMWFANEKDLYFVSGYSGMSETGGYKNIYREELSKKEDYCYIIKRIAGRR